MEIDFWAFGSVDRGMLLSVKEVMRKQIGDAPWFSHMLFPMCGEKECLKRMPFNLNYTRTSDSKIAIVVGETSIDFKVLGYESVIRIARL